ncbi:MAG: helix-turn-helix domain-containing protein [Nitrospira sp. SB0667_bin_9]|nr:helix-turn-helix domain-containing protein [Nitrospira sp. SB0667_bin_9]MYD30230.1 helix-turn-helix domain-containing protein [Nitrospira sp. SB0661_bin_20]
MSTLTERIQIARKQAGLSQADVAKALRISASAVNQWESGFSKNIKLEHFFALARLLRQDPQWLATGTVFPYTRRTQATPPKLDAPLLTREEKAILHHIRRMPDTTRKGLLKFLRVLSDTCGSPDNPGFYG